MRNPQGATGAGFIVSRDVASRKDISPIEKLVLAYVYDMDRYFSKSGGEFRMSMATIAAALGIGERSARASIRNLASLGFLESTARPGQTLLIRTLTPARFAAVPRQDMPDTPARYAGHPGTVCRGTPARFADERTIGTNYKNELPQRPHIWGSEEIEAEKSRIRRSWILARDPDENTNGRGISPRDQQAAASAATERLVVDLDDDALVAAMRAKREFLAASGYESGLVPVLNNIRRPNESKARRTNGKPPIPPRREGDPFGWDPATGRPYHPGA